MIFVFATNTGESGDKNVIFIFRLLCKKYNRNKRRYRTVNTWITRGTAKKKKEKVWEVIFSGSWIYLYRRSSRYIYSGREGTFASQSCRIGIV